jgi:hypothetical protein
MIEVTATVTGAAELLIRIVDGGFPERQYSLRQLATSTSTTLRLEGVVLSPYAQLQLLIHNPSHLWGEVLLDSITYNSGISQHSKGN